MGAAETLACVAGILMAVVIGLVLFSGQASMAGKKVSMAAAPIPVPGNNSVRKVQAVAKQEKTPSAPPRWQYKEKMVFRLNPRDGRKEQVATMVLVYE